MLLRWDVDDANTVTLKIGGFAKSVLTINDREIPSALKLSKKKASRVLAGRRAGRYDFSKATLRKHA